MTQPVNPGVCFCPTCGCSSTEPFYAADVTSDAGWLRKTDQGYYLEAHGDRSQIYHLESPFAPDQQDGMPDSVFVYLEGESSPPSELRRCCPHCFEGRSNMAGTSRKTHFGHYNGRVPIFVVLLIGPPSTGKSAYLGALGSGALDPLNLLDYPYQVTLARTNRLVEISKRTTEYGDKGNSNYLEIRERNRSDEELPAAIVMLLDAGGEHLENFAITEAFDSAPELDTPLRRIIRGDGTPHYTGIHGAILVSPAVDTRNDKSSSETNANSVTTTGIAVGLSSVLRRIPVAFVYSCGDMLISEEERRPDKDRAPLLTRDTFPNAAHTAEYFLLRSKHFEPDRIQERWMIQEEIARSVRCPDYSRIYSRFQKFIRGFIVRSCESIPGENGTTNDNYTHQFNVADPIVWLLTQLKLFPFEPRGGDRL